MMPLRHSSFILFNSHFLLQLCQEVVKSSFVSFQILLYYKNVSKIGFSFHIFLIERIELDKMAAKWLKTPVLKAAFCFPGDSWKTVRVCKLQWMSHAQIFLSTVSPTSHFSSSCWKVQKLEGEKNIKKSRKPNGEITEHGGSFCVKVWMLIFCCVSGLIVTTKAQGRIKSPKITFFSEGHLKTLYKEGREDETQIS